MKEIRWDEIRVVITDSNGDAFCQDWKATADRRDAIRWTIEHGDLPYYLRGQIVCIRILTAETAQ